MKTSNHACRCAFLIRDRGRLPALKNHAITNFDALEIKKHYVQRYGTYRQLASAQESISILARAKASK